MRVEVLANKNGEVWSIEHPISTIIYSLPHENTMIGCGLHLISTVKP